MNEKNSAMSIGQFSFKKGWSQVKTVDAPEVRKKLMVALGVNSRAGFCNRMRGDIEPKITEARAIENVFAEYGITDIWGAE